MQRFYCAQEEIADYITIKDRAEVHHIKDVCRLKLKDKLELINGEGILYKGNIQEIKKDKITIRVEEREMHERNEKVRITLACAIPKNVKMDDIVEKTTQLGVDAIIPLKTKRTIVNFKKEKQEKIIRRWQKIAFEASKQSRRIFVPKISRIRTFDELFTPLDLKHSSKKSLSAEEFNYESFALKLIPTLEEGKRKNIKEIVCESKANSILVLIGPEGDFTDWEIELAKKTGCIPVCLGDFTLKVDTAAIMSVGVLSMMRNRN